MNRSPSNLRGFSLVEITLALGIAAVALVTVLGLLGVAADANGSAGRDTTVVTMTNHVFNALRGARSFDAIWAADPSEAGDKGFVKKPTTPTTQISETSYFFTQEGVMVPKGDPEILYECTVKKTPDLPRPDEKRGPSNLAKLELIFTSPVAANPNDPSKRPHRHVILTSLARF